MIWKNKINQGDGIGGRVSSGEYAPTLADWLAIQDTE